MAAKRKTKAERAAEMDATHREAAAIDDRGSRAWWLRKAKAAAAEGADERAEACRERAKGAEG